MTEQKPEISRIGSVMEDPSSQAIARTYADAFLDAAAATGTEAALDELGSFVDDVLLKVPGLQEIFGSVVVGRDEKIRLIDKVIGAAGVGAGDEFLARTRAARTARLTAGDSAGIAHPQ